MAPKEIILPSKSKLTVNIVDFEIAERLHDAFLSAIHKKGIDLNIDLGNIAGEEIRSVDDLKAIAASNSAFISFMIEKVIQIIVDPELKKALFDAMNRSLYNGEKITRDTFNPVEARKDYYHVCFHVLLENLTPFFQNLGSLLSGVSNPTVKSTQSSR